MAQHPEAEQELLAELDAVLAGRTPTAADWPKLKFTEMIALESMRLYSPAYVIGREAMVDCEIGGYAVPSGMTVLMSQWVVPARSKILRGAGEISPRAAGARSGSSRCRSSPISRSAAGRECASAISSR